MHPYPTLARLASVLALAAGCCAPATAGVDVGVSVQISQPGVYGRIDIGRFPQPVVVQPRPVVVHSPVVVAAPPQPIYMWVPPGHRKNWRKHCGRYNACGVPVYFVQQAWYDQHVMADERRGRGHDDGHHHARGRDRDDGSGKGRGKGRGKDD